jgi:hypothetical protein
VHAYPAQFDLSSSSLNILASYAYYALFCISCSVLHKLISFANPALFCVSTVLQIFSGVLPSFPVLHILSCSAYHVLLRILPCSACIFLFCISTTVLGSLCCPTCSYLLCTFRPILHIRLIQKYSCFYISVCVPHNLPNSILRIPICISGENMPGPLPVQQEGHVVLCTCSWRSTICVTC